MAWIFQECGWRPTKVIRSIQPLKSSTEVIHVELDAGEAFLKGMGNPQGDECLAFELIGTRLARLSGLFVPDYGVVQHEFLELVRISGHPVQEGPAFVSRALPGGTGGGDAFLAKVVNEFDIPLLVAFDTWLANADRCPPDGAFDPTPNWDNIFFVPLERGGYQLTVFDHTHCFAEATLADALRDHQYEQDCRIFGAFPEFGSRLTEDAIRKACQSIRAIDVDAIKAVVDDVPNQWGVSLNARREWFEQINNRRSLLERILMDGLIPQRIMEFGE